MPIVYILNSIYTVYNTTRHNLGRTHYILVIYLFLFRNRLKQNHHL